LTARNFVITAAILTYQYALSEHEASVEDVWMLLKAIEPLRVIVVVADSVSIQGS